MIKFAVRDPNKNAESIKINGFMTLGFNQDNQDNQVLVTLSPFISSYDVHELNKAETLRYRRSRRHGQTQGPLITAANPTL